MRRVWVVLAVVVVGGFAAWVWWPGEKTSPASGDRTTSPGISEGERARIEAARREIDARSWAQVELTQQGGDKSLTGLVVDANGPVAGALVVATVADEETLSSLECECSDHCGQKLLECGCPEAAKQIVTLVSERRGETIPIARTLTGPDGTFQLSGLDDRPVTLWAEKLGTGTGRQADVNAGTEVKVTLEPAAELEGKVVDEEGHPVPGAVLTAIFTAHSRFFDAVSDAEGAFGFGLLPEGEFRIVAVAAPLLPEAVEAKTADHKTLEIKLSRPRTIAGRVERSGGPVADAEVTLEGAHRNESVRTDARGEFEFGSLRRGSYTLEAASDGLKGLKTVMLQEPDVRDLVVSLGVPRAIFGRVTDPDGHPVPGAKLRATSVGTSIYEGRTSAEAVADSNGEFAIEALRGGTWALAGSAEAFMDGHAKAEVGAEGTRTRADLVLERAVTISGVVVDPEGAGVKDARVFVSFDEDSMTAADKRDPEFYAGGWVSSFTRTEEDGSFVVKGLKPETTYDFGVHAEGFLEAKGKVTAPAGGLRWTLPRGATLEGSVLHADGTPVPGAEVSAVFEKQQTGYGYAEDGTAETDDAGAFRMTGLKAGSYVVLADMRAPGFEGTYAQVSARVDVHLNRTAQVVLRFDGEETITGRVVNRDGVPQPKVAVYAGPPEKAGASAVPKPGAAWAGALSGEDGTFVLSGLRAGTYEVGARSRELGAAEPVTVSLPHSEPVELVMASPGRIVGRVVGEDGQPLTTFSIDLRPMSDPDGHFELKVRRAQKRELTIGAPGYAYLTRDIEADEHSTLDLGDVRLSRGYTLTGTVVDADGRPVENALVDVGPLSMASAFSVHLSERNGAVRTNATGQFSLPNVSSEPLMLAVNSEAHPPKRQRIEADSPPLVIQLARGARIVGTLSPQAAVKPGTLVVGHSQWVVKTAMVDSNGTFQVEGLNPGSAIVTVDGPPGTPAFQPKTVTLVDGEEIRVDFAVPEQSCELSFDVPPDALRSEHLAARLIPGTAPPAGSLGELLEPRGAQTTGVNGRLTFTGVAPGNYTLEVITADSAIHLFSFPVEVGTPCPEPRALALEGGTTLELATGGIY